MIRPLIALLLACAPVAAGAQLADAEPLPASMPGEARAALRWLGTQVPTSDAERARHAMNRMRVLHALAATDDEWMDSASVQLRLIERDQGGAVADAYRGALEMLRGKHALWPPAKLEHVRAGRRMLDEAVRAAPGDVEVRYVRLVSGHYLPFFLRDDAQVASDARAVARLLPIQAERFPAGWRRGLARFVLDVVPHDAETAARLERIAGAR